MAQNLYRLIVAAARAIVKEADVIEAENSRVLESDTHPSYGDPKNPSEEAVAFSEFYPAKTVEPAEEESDEEEAEDFYEDDETESEDFGANDDHLIVYGVPASHEIHGVIARLLPDFYAILDIVNEPDFVATQSSAKAALPVWLSFNELSRYKNDPYYPQIRNHIIQYIKPACFAALGKSEK